MFCAEGRQRDGEAQVGQGYDLVEATSLGDIVFRGQQANHEQRQGSGGHREGGAGEFKECGENSWLHGPPGPVQRLKFYDKVSSRPHFSRQRKGNQWEPYSPRKHIAGCAAILAVSSANKK
jgi:hypothetical protein